MDQETRSLKMAEARNRYDDAVSEPRSMFIQSSIMSTALARLLMEKGIVDELELAEMQADVAEALRDKYRPRPQPANHTKPTVRN